MKFIRVTRIFWGAQFVVAVNTAHIIAVKPTTKEDDAENAQTLIYLSTPLDDKDRLYILESFDQVMAAIDGPAR
jgi:hypothetical protein